MENGNFVSYLRVSTARQGISGLGLEAQRAAVAGFLNGGDWTLVQEVLEVESGKRNDRPALATALKLCRKHRATLVIAKLDRLARNVAFISNLMESGVEFVAVDMPQANRFVVHILPAVAEQEAEAISKRTKVALAAAKARGTKLGGRRVSAERFAEIGAAARQVHSQKASPVRSELLIREQHLSDHRHTERVLAGNFGVPVSELADISTKKLHIFPGKIPGDLSTQDIPSPQVTLRRASANT